MPASNAATSPQINANGSALKFGLIFKIKIHFIYLIFLIIINKKNTLMYSFSAKNSHCKGFIFNKIKCLKKVLKNFFIFLM